MWNNICSYGSKNCPEGLVISVLQTTEIFSNQKGKGCLKYSWAQNERGAAVYNGIKHMYMGKC